MHLQKEILINAPASSVWEVLGSNYTRVGDWASVINESAPRNNHRGELEGRTCESTYGSVKEMITQYDEKAHLLSYQADGLPAMFREGGSTWQVMPVDSNKARVIMDLKMKLAPLPGLLMGWMIKVKMSKDTDQLMLDLKHFVETGEPTDAKVKSDEKFTKKRARK
ncbi:MAG: hypothetical protein Roseis2KO_00900 [Roseivirga sp.]